MGNHVVWIDKHFLSLSSLLILNFGIMMGEVKSFKFSECYKFSALELFFFFEMLYLKLQLMMSSALQINPMLLHRWKEVLRERYWMCGNRISRTINLFFFTKCFISRVSGSEGSAPNVKVLDQGEIACVTQECGNQVSLPVITEIPWSWETNLSFFGC